MPDDKLTYEITCINIENDEFIKKINTRNAMELVINAINPLMMNVALYSLYVIFKPAFCINWFFIMSISLNDERIFESKAKHCWEYHVDLIRLPV
jgi:hypothetical protein